MRQIGLTVLIFATAGICFAQSGTTYSSPGGYGNILYPGTGHAPNAPVGNLPSFPQRLGSNIAGRPIGGGGGGGPRVNHNHGQGGIVAYPVIVGGYYPGYYDQQQQQQPYQGVGSGTPIVNTNTAPSVVINQTFLPGGPEPVAIQDQPGMRVYEGLRTAPEQSQSPAPTSSRRSSDQPTIVLLAFKDHNIIPALGYWLEGGNLHYVTADHTLNQVSLDLIDRDMSQQLMMSGTLSSSCRARSSPNIFLAALRGIAKS